MCHKKTVHSGVENHKCNDCGNTFAQKVNLKINIERILEKNKVQCDKCKRSFSDQDALVRHKKISHMNIFQCDLCNR